MKLLRKILMAVTRGFFRLFYELEIKGLENVPATGPVILAPNHVNYLDAPFLLAFVPRPVFFVAAAPAFDIPVWASLMRLYGTIPVVRGKADASAIKASLGVLERGEVLGIFPEGYFTTDGHTVQAKQGASHLAMKTGAPVVPVTFAGAFHSWPRLGPLKRRLPRPWKLTVTFHEPIRISPEDLDRRGRDKAFSEQLTTRIMNDINRVLEPAIRAEAKIDELVAARAPRIRLYELFPLFLSVAAALLTGLRSAWYTDPATAPTALGFLAGFLAIGLLYFLYLAFDLRRARQTAFSRSIRSLSPFLFLVLYYPLLVRGIPFVAQVQAGAPAAYPAWLAGLVPPLRWIVADWLYMTYFAFIPYFVLSLRHYHFHKYLLLQRFARGFLLCTYAALLMIVFLPRAGGYFPVAVPIEALGLLGPTIAGFAVNRLIMGSFPVVVVVLTLYLLAFDLLHHRSTFWTMLVPAASGIAAAVLLRGYPLGAVAVCALAVAAVMGYMRVVRITAHDGRKI